MSQVRLKSPPPKSVKRSTCIPSTDRYVIYGNHRDSWVHGAIDPSSGTSVMLELSRVLGAKVKQGERCSGTGKASSFSGCNV